MVGARDLYLLQNFQIGCGAHPASYSMRTLSFPGIKRPRHEFNLLPLSRAEVKNGWSFISVPPVCLRGMDRENLTFKPMCCRDRMGFV